MSIYKKSNFKDFTGTESFFLNPDPIDFAWIWIRIRFKVRSGSGYVTNFFRSWIRTVSLSKLYGSATMGVGRSFVLMDTTWYRMLVHI